MGVLTSTMRLQYLLNYESDLNYKLMLINQTKMSLLGSNNDLLTVGNDYDPSSPIVKTLQERQAKMKLLEQRLDQQRAAYETQLSAIRAEKDTLKRQQEQEIQRSFSYR